MNNMVLKRGFELVDIAGEYLIVPVGEEVTSFSGVVALSEDAYFLLKNMSKPKTIKELIVLLTQEYNVDELTAEADINKLIKTLFDMGVIEE